MPLKRWEKACAVIGLAMVAVGLVPRLRPDPTRKDILIDTGVCQVPVTVLEPENGQPIGIAAVFHGLSANRRIMVHLGRGLAAAGLRTYLVDLPGHGDNTDPFSFPWAEDCAGGLLMHASNTDPELADKIVLVGHSMGGDIAIRLGRSSRAIATIAISPGPLVPVWPFPDRLRPYNKPQQLPDNLLIFAGGFDLPGFETGARKLLADAQGSPSDGTARELRYVPWGTHTGQIFSPFVDREIRKWLRRAIDKVRDAPPQGSAVAFLLPLGLVLIFPAITSSVGKVRPARTESREEPVRRAKSQMVFRTWAVAALVASLVVSLSPAGSLMNLRAGSFLAGFLALSGLVCVVALWKFYESNLVITARRVTLSLFLQAALPGLYLVLFFGWAVSGDWGDLWMNPVRWGRFLFLIPLLTPYFFAEELALGPDVGTFAADPKGVVTRWATFFTLRLVLWLGLLLSVFLLGSNEILMVVMGLVFAVFSFVQRLAANTVRVRTGSSLAAGFFSAILAAWFIAAVFPLY